MYQFFYFISQYTSNTCLENIWSVLVFVLVAILSICFFIWFTYTMWIKWRYDKLDWERISHNRNAVSSFLYSKSANAQKWWFHANIYHIIIDRFNGGWTTPPKYDKQKPDEYFGGTLKGIKEKLGYIKGQGFNTIMISPVFQSKAYHGYHTLNYSKIDDNYGSWRDFEKLVKAVHDKGMKIICDYVPNHCHKENHLFQGALQFKNGKRDWFCFKDSTSLVYTPFLHYKELPKFNLLNKDAAEYMITVAEKLVSYGVDGLRIDHVVGVPFEFLEKLMKRVKLINPNVFVFGEATTNGIVGDEYEQLYYKTNRMRELDQKKFLSKDELQTQYINLLDGILDFEFRDIMISELNGGKHFTGNANLIQRLRKHFEHYPSSYTPILFLDNHDTNRILFLCNGDKALMDEVIRFMCALPYPYCIYYGTEQYMTNKNDIEKKGCAAYSDLEVREGADWSGKFGKLNLSHRSFI